MFNAFAAKFPKVKVNHTVDLSKYLDGRINQAFQQGELFADMAILQTLQDYDAWEEKGLLLNYKPPSFDKIWPSLTSVNGAYLAVFAGMSFVAFFFSCSQNSKTNSWGSKYSKLRPLRLQLHLNPSIRHPKILH